MAVRHGYGKIAGADALVFAYDTGDTRNSYRGEPTTNLIPNIGTSTSNWSEYGWSGDFTVSSDYGNTFELTATNGWHNATYDFGVSSGGTLTVRFDYKIKSHETNQYNLFVLNGTHLGSYTTYIGAGTQANEWQTFTGTFTANADTKLAIGIRGEDSSGLTDVVYIKNLQLELKPHATPFVNGTRSATQGLLDLTGNYTLDISNASFDSNAFITFDGSSDYIDIVNSTALFSGTQDLTVEAAYSLEGQGGGEIFGNYGTGYTTNHLWFSGMYGLYINGGVYAPGYPLANGRYHMVGTRKNGLVELYLNGELVNSGTKNASIATDINYRIGADVNGAAEPFTGDIYVVKAYSRALTADEVRNNYNFYKSRFNI